MTTVGESARPRRLGSDRAPISAADMAVLAVSVSLAVAFAFVLPRLPDGSSLPDLSDLRPQERKVVFFEYLEPIVRAVNADARADRAFAQQMAMKLEQGESFTLFEEARINALAERYEISVDGGKAQVLEALISRIGTVPVALALVQAAKESGWGTSRFAIEANNLFGQRCYVRNCGIRPRRQSPADNRWGIARFGSVYDSLKSYLLNLNTHPAYEAFRKHRARLRDAGMPVTAVAMAETLDEYSERGDAYVAEISSMIRRNELE